MDAFEPPEAFDPLDAFDPFEAFDPLEPPEAFIEPLREPPDAFLEPFLLAFEPLVALPEPLPEPFSDPSHPHTNPVFTLPSAASNEVSFPLP